jgi:nicotinamide-nucleotide adenylyltransferase
MQYSKTSENPFTFPEREEMIRRTLNANDIPPERYQIIGVADLHDMVKWTRSLLDILDPFDIFYSNNEWTRQLLLQTGKLVAPLYKFQFDRFNGTYIRNRIVRNQPIDDLIPGSVMQYLKEIDGFTRIRKFIDNP